MRKILGDDVCIWADGTWCFYDDLEEMLGHMSDDFEVVPMDTPRYDEIVNG